MEPPPLFVSYASENENLAGRVSEGLRVKGIDVFFAPWERLAGDGLVRMLNEGLAKAEHFVLFLSPESLKKAWPTAEQEVATVRMVEDRVRVMVVNLGVENRQVPPLLRTVVWVDGREGRSVEQIISEIEAAVFRRSVKPPLGPLPPFLKSPAHVFPARPSISLADKAVLQLLFERGIGQMFTVDFEAAAADAAERGIGREGLRDSLEVLDAESLVETVKVMFGGIAAITVSTAAAEECCRQLIPEYDRRKRTIMAAIINGPDPNVTTSESVAERAEEEPWLVGHVLRDADMNGYLKELRFRNVGHESYALLSNPSLIRRLLENWGDRT